MSKISDADVIKVKMDVGFDDVIVKECLIQSTRTNPRELKAMTYVDGNVLLVFDVIFAESV